MPYIKGGKISDFKHDFLQDGDVIFADAAEDETVGKVVEIAGIGNNLIVSGLHTIACRPTLMFSSKYLGYYLNAPSYRNELKPLMQGIKVLSLSWGNLVKTQIRSPKDPVEQELIGELFFNLDNLITLHQRKLKINNLISNFPKDVSLKTLHAFKNTENLSTIVHRFFCSIIHDSLATFS